MLSLGTLSFAAPWALLALAALPLLWWLLRLTPPAPWLVRFPPVRLLLALAGREESAAKSPWWLVLLRLLLVACAVLAAAHPLFNAGPRLGGSGPLYLVVDNGWAAAADWRQRQLLLADLVGRAGREERPVVVVATAPADGDEPAPGLLDARAAAERIATLQPLPWPERRSESLLPLSDPGRFALPAPGHVVWLSNGLDSGDTDAFVRSLRRFGTVTVIAGDGAELPLILRPPLFEGETLKVTALRAQAGAAETRWARALAADGTPIGRVALKFEIDARSADARLHLPAELRGRLARLALEGGATAASVVLLDERWRRRPVGLVSAEGSAAGQPLLGDLYYLERALKPFTEVRRGAVTDLRERQLAMLVLADPGRLQDEARNLLEDWISRGGVAVRFAGRRLAGDTDVLLPVALRQGDRMMGGSMSWRQPATLAPFSAASPFHGLAVPADVRIRRQVLARPSLDLAARTWARLDDGTPLVTAEKRGNGWLVLVHTTANAAWSNLPISGLFVEMLRRLVALGQGVVETAATAPLPPIETLDAFARLGPPPASARPIAAGDLAGNAVGATHPPGYYGREAARHALNLSAAIEALRPLGTLPPNVEREAYGKPREVDIRPWFLLAALLFAIADLAASLALRRLLAITVCVLLAVPGAQAQTSGALALETRLAYVITGDAAIDDISRAGLDGLARIVNRRTAAHLGAPAGVDPETDELAFFPLLYWPVTGGQAPPSPRATRRLDTYMQNGGTILFDTRDGDDGMPSGILQELRGNLDIPPLVGVPRDHVLGRAYYLLQAFPGRWTGGRVWVEQAGAAVRDGVSAVIVGSHDWAAAWAEDAAGQPLFAAVPGGERQREMAFRFGINLVMYTLTGNYKADQVHLPAIIERLGR